MNRGASVALLLSGFNIACGPVEPSGPPALGASVRHDEVFHGGSTEPDEPGGLGGMGGAPAVSGREASTCNNGIWDESEICDGSAGGVESCQELGFDEGETRCTDSCGLDVSGCFFNPEEPRAFNICGDGFVDDEEDCDDEDEPGCNSDCTLKSSEHEPNDSDFDAEYYVAGEPFYGSLETGDEDWLQFSVEHPPGSLTASVIDLLAHGCAEAVPGVNPALELLDSLGDPIAWDSDSGPGECALLAVGELAAGTYYIRVLGEMSGSFPYVLDVAVE